MATSRLTKITTITKAEKGSESFEAALKEFKSGMKVDMAYLHAAVMVPGAIGSETSLTPEKVPGIEMATKDAVMYIRLKDCIAILPHASIKAMIIKA